MNTIISAAPTRSTTTERRVGAGVSCPGWCRNPAHRLLDTLAMPSRDEVDLAASEPHEGPLRGLSTSPDIAVDLFAHQDGTSGVALSLGGEAGHVLPLGEAVARLTAMADALRGAAEDLAVVRAATR